MTRHCDDTFTFFEITSEFMYSHLSNNRGGEAKIAKSLNVEAGINAEVGKYLCN